MRLKIENWMRYAYDKAVGFSTHVVRLYPRTDQSIVTHRHRTSINMESDIQYRRDLFDNLVANCFLPKQGEVLEIRVELELDARVPQDERLGQRLDVRERGVAATDAVDARQRVARGHG